MTLSFSLQLTLIIGACLFSISPSSFSHLVMFLFQQHVEEFGVEASAGVQEDAQVLESLPVFKVVYWNTM